MKYFLAENSSVTIYIYELWALNKSCVSCLMTLDFTLVPALPRVNAY